mmetsp:Transcript_56635/g.172412  ORF Transcript_56635/g.172412 Transcript_56635/m.172412 type:complete len:286 (-) Transcript_56635:476-1333(-)
MGTLTREVMFAACLIWLLADGTYDFGKAWPACSKPINSWNVGNFYVFLLARLCYITGSLGCQTDYGDFMLNMRHKGAALQVVYWVTWLLCLPVHAAWTVVGYWRVLRLGGAEPHCLPAPQLIFVMAWLGLGCIWLVVHVWLLVLAVRRERRLRGTQRAFALLVDRERSSRWGEASRAPDDSSAQAALGLSGMAAADIKALPGAAPWRERRSAQGEEHDCPICLEALQDDDVVRTLGNCGHTFHRACIDLWLLRSANCPMCKSAAKAAPEGGSAHVSAQRQEAVHV